MFILGNGIVELLDKSLHHILTTLESGAYFGEGCILGDVRRNENLRAQTFTELCRLDAGDIDDLLETYPHLHRALHDAYHKRKVLLRRYEVARAGDSELTLTDFVGNMNKGPTSEDVTSETVPVSWDGRHASEGGERGSGGVGSCAAAGKEAGTGAAMEAGSTENDVTPAGRSASWADVGAETLPRPYAAGTQIIDDVSDDDQLVGNGIHASGPVDALSPKERDGHAPHTHTPPHTSLHTPLAPRKQASAPAFVTAPATPRARIGSRADPTLNFELPAPDMEKSKQATMELEKENSGLGFISSGGASGTSIKKLEIQVNTLAANQVSMETKLDTIIASMRRMEMMMLARAAAKKN